MINNDYYQDFPQAWSQETQEAWAPTQAGPAVLDYPSMQYGEDFVAIPLTATVYEPVPDIPHDRGPGLLARFFNFGFGLSHGYRP